jgi:hypothetical protein
MKDEKLIKAISKLNQLTQENKIKWEIMEPPSNLSKGRDVIIPFFYGTKYKANNFGIYEVRYETISHETGQLGWDNVFLLSVFSDDWMKLWSFPRVSGVYDLLRSVGYQIGDIGKIVDSILSED